jgi:hypothetical protein
VTQPYGIAIVGAVLAVALVLELLRRRQLTEKYATIWLIVALGIVVLAAFPDLLIGTAGLVGVEVPSNLLFFGAAFVLLFVCLQLSRETSRLEEETRTLAEELALLRHDLDQLQARR